MSETGATAEQIEAAKPGRMVIAKVRVDRLYLEDGQIRIFPFTKISNIVPKADVISPELRAAHRRLLRMIDGTHNLDTLAVWGITPADLALLRAASEP